MPLGLLSTDLELKGVISSLQKEEYMVTALNSEIHNFG